MFKVGDRVEYYKPWYGDIVRGTVRQEVRGMVFAVEWDEAPGKLGTYMDTELKPCTAPIPAKIQAAWDDMGTYFEDAIRGKPMQKACTCGAAKVKDHGHSTWCDIKRAG
jgi:hypothetical protein